jgi:adhesin transport system membrane fusion protein
MSEAAHLEDFAQRIKPRAASNLLLWGVAAFVVVFFVWASFTTLERVVSGIGRVIPSSQLQVVSNLEGGVVENILVKTGDMVRPGQELVRLDPTQTGSELGSGEASLFSLRLRIARLEAEVGGRTPAFGGAPDGGAAEQVRAEQALHSARLAELADSLNAGQSRVTQAERAVNEARSAYQARLTAYEGRQSEVNTLRRLVDRGIEPRMSLTQAESAAAVARSEAAAASSSIARAQASVAEARSSLSQLRQTWRAQAATQLTEARTELASRRTSLPALTERVERTSVRSPLAGRINRVLVTTRGAAVQPGQPLVEIVPSEENLLIEARVRPEDIGSVRIGQQARVGITAYDPSVYGKLEGEVVSMSPDAVLDEQTGETFYQVLIRTSSRALATPQGQSLPIGAGMVADVSLRGDDRTILEYLLTPITRLREKALRE